MIEILNLRKTETGYLINGYIVSDGSEKEVKAWVKAGYEVMPPFTAEELARIEEEKQKILSQKVGA